MLLKNPENLLSKANEQRRLNQALELNHPLAIAYYMKEELRHMWSCSDRTEADEFIMSWITRAEQSGVKMLFDFAKTIRRHYQSILAHYIYPISTGVLEGINNKIKTLSKQAYGFRDPHYYKLKIMNIHRAKYQLTG